MSDWDLPSGTETTSNERIGGGGAWESGVYAVQIKLAYLDQAKSGAIGLNIVLQDSDGRELKDQMWIKSGDSKGNKTFYEKDGKKYPLPGYSTANSMCVAATSKGLPDAIDAAEKKTINIYNFETKKEMPTERPVLMSLKGKKVTVAIRRIIEDKNVKNAAGEYVASGETRTKNECVFFGDASGKSAEEIQKGTEATILTMWADKNTGVDVDKSSGKAAVAPKTSAAKLFG